MTTIRSNSSKGTIVEDFQKEIEEMNEDDSSTRLKFIKELDSILGLLEGRKEKKKKDLGIRNYPKSCMERSMINEQVHGI